MMEFKKIRLNGSRIEELQKLLSFLASNWGDVLDVNSLKVVHLSGAMTNLVYKISWPTKKENVCRMVLLRVYGEGVEILFSRDDEIRTFEYVSKQGFGPQLLGQFPWGRVEEFIDVRTLSASDLRDPEISSLIAMKLREFHNIGMPCPTKAGLWDRLRDWLGKAKTLCSAEDIKEFRLNDLEKEIETLEKELSRDSQMIGFCHNDLQYGNMMFDEKTRSITIIDYEYASYNPIAYDFANHFCEMTADYHTETPHVLDYTKYPGVEERRRFVHSYLSSAGHEPRDSEVKQLVDDAEKYILPNHLFWGLWGIISGYVNSIDFDYKEYARQRFCQYWLKKPEFII
ncbi:probable choline kinase 3 [Ipomoea triloba]|uniref:probable choline kinase 3 n=1 Tax=Ipomoea triloba TaxID=35885 RepID=UPI00125DFD3E|nr:probable choline kinase 3 [Ipomoea triloba]